MPDSTWWDEEYDVVVAGGGGAGLMAAVEAAERGASVLLVEKQPDVGGGATGMCIGSITAAGTALQQAAGIKDNSDAHYETVKEMMTAQPDEQWDPELSRLMVECAPGAIARLTELGVEFSGPHPEPPHSVYRMHNVVPDSNLYCETLARAARERGVTIRTDTTITELQQDDRGAVSILALRHVRGTDSRAVRVNRAVVLAAGGFSANDELARAHGRPPEISAVDPIQPQATGDCLILATELGADTVGMHRTGFPSFRTALPPYALPDRRLFVEGAVLINKRGQRFTDELDRAAFAANEQPDKLVYVVFDARLAARIATADEDSATARDGWYRNDKLFLSTFPGVAYAYLDDYRQRSEYLFEAGSVAELAREMQVPEAALESSLREFNEAAAGDAKDPFGRTDTGPGVSEPPFYAVGPVKPVLNFSGGGLKVDREMHVLDTAGKPIPHLYACGTNAEAGVFLGGHGHHLAWAFGTGGIAGTNAAAEDPISNGGDSS